MRKMTTLEFDSLPVWLNKPPIKIGQVYRRFGNEDDFKDEEKTLAVVLVIGENKTYPKGFCLSLEPVELGSPE